jgi:hypothetical protein
MASAAPSVVSTFSAAPSKSRAALTLIRRRLQRDYVHNCSLDDALQILEVMPPGKDCIIRRFVDDPARYKVKVRGHAEEDIYDESTMFSLIHGGEVHFVRCQDTVRTFFQIRTPPQLQHGDMEQLFLHPPATTTEEALQLLKAHYQHNAAHPDHRQLLHVILLRQAGGSMGPGEQLQVYFVDPSYGADGAVLNKPSTLVKAAARFMQAVVVPASTPPSSAVQEPHTISVAPYSPPPPAPSVVPASVVPAAPQSVVPAAPPSVVPAAPASVVPAAPPSVTPSAPASVVPAAPASVVPPSVVPAAPPSVTSNWPACPETQSEVPPPPAPPLSPPPLDLQSAPGTVFTAQ